MSTSANKLDYARIRNAQRKSNKSIHELKDSTNTQNNDIMNINDSTQQQDLPVQRDSLNNQSSNNHNEVTPRQNNNNRSDFLDVFKGPNFSSGNLDYVNSLIMSNNKSNTSISGRDHSTQKGKGHKRAKSSLADSSQKLKSKNNDENSEPPKKPGRILNILEAKEGQEPASKEEKEQRNDVAVEKEEIQKTNKDTGNSVSQRNPHNTPYAKDGKLFDEFFKTGGLMRKSMSLEDLRVDKKQIKGEESVTERVDVAGNNSEGLDKSGMSLSKKDFLGSLNGYIQYFDNSEAAYMKNKSAILKRYFLGHEHKGNNMLKKELETAKEETKMVKKNMEAVQKKMIEMIKENKMLMKEMNESRLKEEAYQERIREVEEQFEKMKERKEYYKDKASQMQEQLEIERVENENNMMMLKKVMARNINHGLDSRGMVYTSHKRDKSLKENDYLRGMPQKHRNDFILGNPLKEKKSVNGGVYYNNRYDGHQQDHSRVKGHGQGKIYDLSMISHKEDMGSTSEEFTSENHMQSTSSVPYLDTSYQRDVFHEMYMSEITEKKLSKEEQIRYIQDKIVNLIEEEAVGSPYGYERHSSPKSVNKHRHKASESNMHVYPAHRERESVYARQNYSNYSISQKPEYQLKTKTKSNNMENRVPDSALIDRYYLTNKSD